MQKRPKNSKTNRKVKKRIYLDYAAITPIEKRVSLVMKKAENKLWANPSSLHQEGEAAKQALLDSRIAVAKILHCKKSEIYFTSGGTESLNIGISGVVEAATEKGITPHIILSAIEHPSVTKTVKNLLDKNKIEASFINPNEEGIINPASIEKEIKQNTVLVVLMHSNNEIGTIQPVNKVASIIKDKRKEMEDKNPSKNFSEKAYPYLLVDASQSALYEDVSLERLGADILVLDSIKMYGPRGVGIVAVKSGVQINPIIFGGGQEESLRPGTENVLGIVGITEALKIAEKKRTRESLRIKKIRDYAIAKILKEIRGASLNGSLENRLPNNINICLVPPKPLAKGDLSKIDSEFLVIKLDTLGFAVSAASACNTLTLENSSYVIEALGKKECASSSLRFTLGRSTTKSDLDALIKTLKSILKK